MPITPKRRKNIHLTGIFRQIFVSNAPELAPFAMVFVYPPENFEQKKLGTLFGVIKISDTSRESSYVANLLASVIKKEYFAKPDRPTDESFEASLRKANLALAELARRGSVKWTGEINFAGGALEKNNLHFSKLGTTAILLLRAGMIADIASGMGTGPEKTDSHPLKTFSDISSGKIEKDDCLIFTTSDLLEIFSPEELRQNAARFPCEEFPDILSASLKANSELSGTIIVNLIPEEEIQPATERAGKRNDFSAIRTSAGLADVAPAEKTAIPKYPTHIDIPNVAAPMASKNDFQKERNLYVSEMEDVVPRKSFGKKIGHLAAETAARASVGISFIWRKSKTSLGKINWRKIFHSIGRFFSVLFLKAQKVDWRKKNTRIWAAASLAVVLLAYFSFSGIFGNRNPADQEIQDPEQSDAPAPLPDDINTINIGDVSEVAALPADSRELMFSSGALYTLASEKSVLKINPVSGQTEKDDSDIASAKFVLAADMPDLNTIFILTADKKIISFTPINKRFQENGIALPDNLNAVVIKAFLTYLYVFDPAANQIYRYPRAEGGFGEQQSWLRAGTDIKGLKSFTINEDIFAASDGQITAWLQGRKDDEISFENPSVPLAIDRIFSAPDLGNVYVLDNQNHRVVQYAKDGKIAAQYFSDQISGVKNFTVDEKNKVVYLLKNDRLLKFNTE